MAPPATASEQLRYATGPGVPSRRPEVTDEVDTVAFRRRAVAHDRGGSLPFEACEHGRYIPLRRDGEAVLVVVQRCLETARGVRVHTDVEHVEAVVVGAGFEI